DVQRLLNPSRGMICLRSSTDFDSPALLKRHSSFHSYDDKMEQQSQPSPGSAKSSSNDSGVEESRKASVSQPKPVERRATRLSSNAVSPVLEQLEQLIVNDDWLARDEPPLPTQNKKTKEGNRLSELGRTLVTSSSLKAYIDLLGSHHRQSIASWLFGNTSITFSQLFRFPEAQVYCSETESTLANAVRNGIGHAVRLAIKQAYGGEFATKGWRVFVEQGAPVVYVSPALHLDIAPYLASEFGICDIIVLPKLDGDLSEIEGRIDHHAFEKQLDEDLAAGKKPLMVLGVVGSSILGQNDMISKLLDIRKNKARFWLHIVGQAVAALTLREPTEVLVHVLSQVDSMTLPLALWLGIPAAPVITIHRSVDGYKPTYRAKLDTLPWWVASQYLTTKRITDIIENAYFLSKVMLKGLSALDQMEIVGVENVVDFANKVFKNQYIAPSVLIFKYKYEALKEAVAAHKKLLAVPEEEKDVEAIEKASKVIEYELEYAESLNSWLGQGLLGECTPLGIHMIELGGNYGTAFRFCPLEHAAANSSNMDHVQKFIKQLSEVLSIVDSTVAARRSFCQMKTEFPSLAQLPINKWAGVGAVCYIPSIVKETNPEEWNEKQRQQVSMLNMELVHSLRSVDSAFSSGESALFGVNCVKFGMLSDAKDLVDLMNMVSERGKEIENSQQYLDTLAEQIRKGIEAANQELKHENDVRLQHEGVMRQLPLMGSLVNWFSPIEHPSIKGRSFNLKTGEIQATDVLYKHKKGEEEDIKVPMTPIETPQAPHDFNKNTILEKTESISEEVAEEWTKPEEETASS
ncbi:hypothetical protein PFISCL1PPCAC_26755, partial [Pristionchus fissidentatus]